MWEDESKGKRRGRRQGGWRGGGREGGREDSEGDVSQLGFFFPLGRLSNTYAGGCVRKGRGERKQKWKEGIGEKGI